jgi:hypothetical protein
MFKFIKTKDENNEYDKSNISFEIDDDASLFDLLEEFKKFIIACGYSVNDNDRFAILNEDDKLKF